ncbi:MAG: AI-2E family transporter [Caldimonas sp.]|nr:AI-2E family transporter [Pseudomonadota bacterium]
MKTETVRTTAVLALFAACVWLLHSLLAPIIWAALIAVATWPLHDRLRAMLGRQREPLSAVILTGAVVLFLLVPLGYLLYRGVREMPHLLRFWSSSEQAGLAAPAWLAALPGVGAWAVGQWNDTLGAPGALNDYAHVLLGGVDFEKGRTVVALVAHHAMSLFFCVLVLFFLYLGGDAFAAQIDAVLSRHVGPVGKRTRTLALSSVRGAINGMVLVGCGVAVLMCAAYLVAGVPHPFAWGLATGLLGMVPFGATLVLAGVVVYFLANAATMTAVWLGIFGATAIFIADHFMRPHLMSGSSKLPLVLALLGIVGGLETFGILGLFLGPTLLAVMVAIWRELAAPHDASDFET